MKKSVEILGLPVISISEGSEIGTTKALVIDPVQGAVVALAIDDGKWYLGAKLLPFTSISGLGESALTVESSNSIQLITNAPDMEKLLANEIKVIGAKIWTKTGRIGGKVTEINIDTTGKIVSCEIDNNGELSQLPAQRVITYGKDVLVILDTESATPEFDATPIVPVVPVIPVTPIVPVVEEIVSDSPAAAKAPSKEAEVASDESGKKFEDKQRKYLLGKKASKRIETDSGVVIVDAGGEITEEAIQKAKLAGKFVELSMSI